MAKDWFVTLGLRPKPLVDGPRYGSANDRCMAAVIDISILFLLLRPLTESLTERIYAAFHLTSPLPSARIESFSQLAQIIWQTRYPWVLSNGLIFLIMGICVLASQMIYGTTPGKWLLGLKIVRHGTEETPSRGRYVLRFFGYILSCLPLMIGVFWMSFNRERRAWHDYIAGTAVISTRPQGWYWRQFKRPFRWAWRKLRPSTPMENTVGEPAAGEGHEDRG